MSSVLEVPAQLTLAMLLATGQAPATAVHPAWSEAPAKATVRAVDLDYTDDAWLGLMQSHGEAAGIGPMAKRVFRTSTGRVYVPLAEDRQALLTMKRNPEIVTRIATAVALAHAQRLRIVLGRPARPSELLLAHQVGVEVAASLLLTANEEPRRPASEVAPEAALAYPAAFFQGTRSRTAEGVVQLYAEAFEKSVQVDSRPLTTATLPAPVRKTSSGGATMSKARASSPQWSTVVTGSTSPAEARLAHAAEAPVAPPAVYVAKAEATVAAAAAEPALATNRLHSFSAVSSAAFNRSSSAP